jgi:hypothetical protein
LSISTKEAPPPFCPLLGMRRHVRPGEEVGMTMTERPRAPEEGGPVRTAVVMCVAQGMPVIHFL